MFPCLGPEFVAALERSVKKAEGSMMRRPGKRYKAFYKLTAASKRVWQKASRGEAKSWQRPGIESEQIFAVNDWMQEYDVRLVV